MPVLPRKNGLDSLFKEVRVFKEGQNRQTWKLRRESSIFSLGIRRTQAVLHWVANEVTSVLR